MLRQYIPATLSERILAVLILLTVVALIDWLVKREKATRWREYSFLVLGGLVGAVFGVLIDQMTYRISPDYFLYAKNLSVHDFDWNVIKLGAQAGMTAGVITVGVLMIGNTVFRKEPVLPLRGLIRYVGISMIASLGAALMLGLVFAFALPDSVVGSYNEVITPDKMLRFKAVVGAHYGLYLGGIVATAICIVLFRRGAPKS